MEGVAIYYDSACLDNLEATELRLGLPGSSTDYTTERKTGANKRALDETTSNDIGDQEVVSMTKVRVVGWPPVRSYRKNSFSGRKTVDGADGIYVKVSMDGAPYLRKIDLKVYNGYEEMREALLEDRFKCFSSGKEGNSGSDYAITYEDKDGDWMLAGDVPWRMFISSCKRLRIMRGPEARSGFKSMTNML